jgi:metal-responsive CopG/Arc/MetJ family transcriptional regulator
MTASRKVAISVSLDESQVEQLDEISRRTKIARSVLVREGVKAIVARYEEQLSLPLGADISHTFRGL